MDQRQFVSGLSGGIGVLAVAGGFWLGLGIGSYATRIGWLACSLLTILQVGGCAALLVAALRMRKRAKSWPRQPDAGRAAVTRHILFVFVWTSAAQAILIAGSVWWCVQAHAEPLIWPLIALFVSLHFVPLAGVFHVPTYRATGATGAFVAIIGLASAMKSWGLALLSAGMMASMWLSALYLLRNAGEIAERAVRERWAS